MCSWSSASLPNVFVPSSLDLGHQSSMEFPRVALHRKIAGAKSEVLCPVAYYFCLVLIEKLAQGTVEQ